MKLTHVTALTTLAFGTTTLASQQLVKNFCERGIWLTFNTDGQRNEPFELPSGQAFVSPIEGQGNEAIVSKKRNIYSDETGKLVLGTSSADGTLYWSVGNVTGDPFAGQNWSVTSGGREPDVCGNATTYEFNVGACQDIDVTLTLNLCTEE